MLRDGEPLGAILIRRLPRCVRSPNKQIELLETFADQAVIAIENARLFEEVQARTRGAAGVAEVADRHKLRCSRSSAARPIELQPVLDTIVETAGAALRSGICIRARLDRTATITSPPLTSASRIRSIYRSHPIAPGGGSLAAERCSRATIHVAGR